MNIINISSVPNNIFTKFIHLLIPTYEHFFAFKKQFAIQLAITSFIGYILSIGNRIPSNILFSRSTENLLQCNFFPSIAESGLLLNNEAVPFKLTRNLFIFECN